MICPKCNREVSTLHGNGKYPNSTYKCNKCYDDEMGEVVKYFVTPIIICIFALCFF